MWDAKALGQTRGGLAVALGSFSAAAVAGVEVYFRRVGLEGGEQGSVDCVDCAVVFGCHDVSGCGGVVWGQNVDVLLVHTRS